MSQRNESSEISLDYRRVHLSVRWDTVFIPFEQWKFLEILPQSRYIVSARQPSPLFGAELDITAEVATKGQTRLFINSERRQLGIDAPRPDVAVEEVQAIEDLLLEHLRFNSREAAIFYEIDCQAHAWTGKSPLRVVTNFWSGFKDLESLSKIIREQCANYTVHLFSPDKSPLSPDWLDIVIQPSFRSPDTNYSCLVVYRNPSRERVFDFANRLHETLTALIQKIEQGHGNS